MSDKPYLITPIEQIGHQKNALRVEFIEPQDRCRLRPRDDFAKKLVDLRPNHLGYFWQAFGYCINDKCAECRVLEKSTKGSKG